MMVNGHDNDDDDDIDDHDDGEDAANIFSPDVPSEKRVRRWAVSLENIIMDPLGVEVKQHHHELDIFVFNNFLAFFIPRSCFLF